MTLSDRVHKAAEGRWWHAPLTLVAYWSFALLCLVFMGNAIVERRFDHLRRGLRLLAGGDGSVTFDEQPFAFILLVVFFAALGVGLFLIGSVKFARRRRAYLAHAKYI